MALKVVELSSQLTPDKVLEEAKGQYESIMVLGYKHDGNLLASFSDSLSRQDSIVFIMEQLKHLIINGED